MRFLKHIQARFALPLALSNQSVDIMLDDAVRRIIAEGIQSVSVDKYYIVGVTNKGMQFRMWNANKYYAWLNEGVIGSFQWKDARPTAATMLELRNAIRHAIKNQPCATPSSSPSC
jgi:hypothetical protein